MFFVFDDTPSVDFLTLPGFAEAKRHLKETGHPSTWITKLVDTSDKYAKFLKDGRPWYRSQCPHYQGYWLEGCRGSVQCGSYGGLLPDLMWDTTCKGKFEQCPFYTKGERCEQ